VRPRYAFAAIALASVVVLVARAGVDTTPAGGPARLLGVTNDGGKHRLVQLAPASLRPLPGPRVRLGAPEAWALSPGGSRLAAVSDRGSLLRLIDVQRMRSLRRLSLPALGSPAAVVWPRPDRLWGVLTPAAGSTTVVAVDPLAERIVTRRRLEGGLVRVAESPDGPVLLLGPPAVIGPARLVTVDAAGGVEQLPLDGVSAGAMPTDAAPGVERLRTPALAVDAGRRRAYVLSSRPHAIEIDLRRRRVGAHRLVARVSLLDRLRELLEPSAAASPQVGIVRRAAFIGEGRIALSGYDADVVVHPQGAVESERRPAGLHVIDTHDWSVHTLDERASGFAVAAGLLLTSGAQGLTAYSPEGREAFHLLGDRHVEVVATAGSLAYVRTRPGPALQVVDVTRGRVVGERAADLLLISMTPTQGD
jgi:hypothetical protein